MNKKSISIRNLIGGFLGGAIGILSSWYLIPTIMPVTVLIGVVVGWWNEDIVHLFRESHQRARKAASGFVGTVDNFIASLARLCGLPAIMGNAIGLLAKAIIGAVVAIVMSPVTLARYLKEHLLHQVFVLRVVTALLLVFGVPATIGFFAPDDYKATAIVLGFFVMAFGFMAQEFRKEQSKNIELAEMNEFYRHWEIIDRNGPFKFFLHFLLENVRCTVGLLAFCAVALPWFFAVFIPAVIGIYPLIFCIGVAVGFCKIANLPGHWLCFGVTLAVTALSWFLYHEDFADPRILWTVALGTGLVSGVATEILRKALLLFFDGTAFGKIFASGESAMDIITDEKKGYIDLMFGKFGGMWFQQNRLARMLRALCFGVPVAQPVRIV